MISLSALIRRGYSPQAPFEADLRWLAAPPGGPPQAADSQARALAAALPDLRDDPLAILLPTYLGRADEEGHRRIVAHVAEQTAEFEDAAGVVLMIGLQHRPQEESAAEKRLSALVDAARSSDPGLAVLGFAFQGQGKLLSTNAAVPVARAAGSSAMILLDDDIHMEPGTLLALFQAFSRRGHGGAIGAGKISEPSRHWSGRLLRWVGTRLEPARAYPHACCMIVDLSVIADGIPWRYVDDGYIFFELVEPESEDPLHRLQLEPSARCRHVVGSDSSKSTLARQRRMLIMHHVFMADYPAKARYYRRHMLFYGLWPVGARARDPDFKSATVRALLKAIYFSMFVAVGFELAIRGLARRPLVDTGWGPAPLLRPQDSRDPSGRGQLDPWRNTKAATNTPAGPAQREV